ncbi:MAG: FHA domain-containing protein [Lentisphaeraceae bacterium]|nr:FHA domain-containing protein [Lentisphaeraceae bacterium]
MSNNIHDFVGSTGRINNTKFTTYINSISREKFIASMSHPVLVSRKLYEGELSKVGDSKNTMVFSVQAIRERMAAQQEEQSLEDTFHGLNDDENFSQSIYALRKNRDSTTSPNVFTIGRIIPNDLIIPDFTISKQHSAIRLEQNKYYITDLGSTNGTLVAGTLLKANESKVLNDFEFITIGRLGFVFMHQAKIYDLLRR